MIAAEFHRSAEKDHVLYMKEILNRTRKLTYRASDKKINQSKTIRFGNMSLRSKGAQI